MFKGRITGKACASVQQGGNQNQKGAELTIIITDLSIYNCQCVDTNITTNVHAYDVRATSSTGDHASRGIHSFIQGGRCIEMISSRTSFFHSFILFACRSTQSGLLDHPE